MPKEEKKQSSIEIKRHSLAHLLAAAVLEIDPKAKTAIGPAIENGFYYDFDLTNSLSTNDLPRIEKKMREMIKENVDFVHSEISAAQAKKLFKNNPFKLEVLEKEAKGKEISVYKSGKFPDLCRGPHAKSAGQLNPESFKLTKIAGAYWRGDENNKMLTRIYGAAFDSKKELENYLKAQEEAEKRDHKKLGRELELFHIDENVGKGLPLWMPKGAIIRQILQRFIEDEETKRGYSRTYTPVIGNVRLYKMSGHWDHYRNDMYPAMKIDNEQYVLRPMTCPHQFMIYKAKPHSYKELPLRYAELAEMYRREKSGELSGLIRVMGFTLSDAHIICTPDQLEKEFLDALELIRFILKSLGIDKNVTYRASLRDKQKAKYISNEKLWDESEKALLGILEKAGVSFENAVGEAAFYGPKADIQIKNVHGKEETLITAQIDLNSAERFDLFYIDRKGQKQRPVIIHRSSLGCIERTMAFLIEHYAGAFPLWLSPVQAQIIPVSDKHAPYAKKVAQELNKAGLRVEVAAGNETLGKRIREGQIQKIPYLLIVGDKEAENNSVAVRERNKGDLGTVSVDKFQKKALEEIQKKSL